MPIVCNLSDAAGKLEGQLIFCEERKDRGKPAKT